MSEINRRGGLVHWLAGCNDCDKRWETRNAQAVAVQHAKKHRHSVWVELGFSYTYSPVSHPLQDNETEER